MLKLDTKQAAAADNLSSPISEAGKYIGTITRAEALTATKGTKGLGLSFKADNGQTADYLDLYHTNQFNEPLSALKTVNAIMACLSLKEAAEGPVQVEKWNKDKGQRERITVTGYPQMMGKKIGFLLRKVLETTDKGKDREKIEIFGVFNADSELTASEILSCADKPEKLTKMLDALMSRPVVDKRKGGSAHSTGDAAGPDRFDGMPMDDDLPF